MTNEMIRNGEVIHTGAVDVFEFDQKVLLKFNNQISKSNQVIPSEQPVIIGMVPNLEIQAKKKCVLPSYCTILSNSISDFLGSVHTMLAFLFAKKNYQ